MAATCSWSLGERCQEAGCHKCRSWKARARKRFVRRDSRSPAAQTAVLWLTWARTLERERVVALVPTPLFQHLHCSLCSLGYRIYLTTTEEYCRTRGISFGYVYCICTVQPLEEYSICKNFDWANSSYFCTFSHQNNNCPRIIT